MKKVFFSILLIGFGILGYSQDKTYDAPTFSTFPPTGWTVANDQAFSGTANNWKQSIYPMVVSDDQAEQEERIISPTIVGTLGNSYQVSFIYRSSAWDADVNVHLLMSLDNGTTWAAHPFTGAGNIWTKGANAADIWYSAGPIDISTAAGNSIKLAFIYHTTAPVTDGYFAVDNIVVEENLGAFKSYKFETGLTAGGWTKVNTPSPGSAQHFADKYLAKVDEDATLEQDEWLKTKDYIISNNALTTVTLDMDWYALLNTAGYGAQLYVSTDHGTSFSVVDDISLTGNTTFSLENYSYNLDSYKGDTVMLAIRFTNTPPLPNPPGGAQTNFFLNSFKVSQVFNYTEWPADALFSPVLVVPPDSLIYPGTTKYNGTYKEGFWQVEPESWSQTKTSKANWRRAAGVSDLMEGFSHDYVAYIDTVGADKANMNETLSSQTIDIKYPSVGASYYLSFEWITEPNLNCGKNTDPNLGSAAKYDFADAIVEIRTNNGTTWSTWTKIWQEDDQTILNATTSKTGTNYTSAWTTFQDYLNTPWDPTLQRRWYKANLDITQYAVNNKKIEVRFNYKGNYVSDDRGPGYFALDNFYILRNQNPQFELEATVPISVANGYHIDYTRIPISQIINPVKLGARLTSYGIKTFTNANLTFTVTYDATTKTYGYRTVKPADFTTWPSTKYLEADNRAVEFTSGINLASGKSYTVTASGEINGNVLSESQTFDIYDVQYAKYDFWPPDSPPDSYVGEDTISGGKGSIFEIKVKDKIDKVTVYLGNITPGSETYMTVIQLASPSATSGTLVYTSPRKVLPGDYQNLQFDIDLTLNPGFYAFMFNQTDQNELNLGIDDGNENATIPRGNSSHIYYDKEEQGDLLVQIDMAANNDPEIVTEFTNDKHSIVAGEAAGIEFVATDEDGDELTWPSDADLRIVEPKWLGEWMTFTDDGEGTLTIGGTPTSEYLGVTHVTLTVQDARNGTTDYEFDLEVLSEAAYVTPDFSEVFEDDVDGDDIPDLWITKDDVAGTGSDYYWRLLGDAEAHIYGDSNNDQDEWLISPPIYLPETDATADTLYHLEFDWKVNDFNYFCGGTAGVLGSSKVVNGVDTYNFADVTLLVSTDQGATWSEPLWQEDSPTLVPPITKGIFGGKNWTYNSNPVTLYTSVIDLSAYNGEKVMFAFRYQGKNAQYTKNRFTLDNFEVLINNEVDLSVYARTAFQYIPGQQVDMTKGITCDAFIENKGRTIPDGATYTIECAEKGYFSTGNLNAAFFATGDVQKVSYTLIPDTGVYKTYYFKIKVDADNNASGKVSHTISTGLHADTYSKIKSTSREVKTFEAFDGIGVIYELTQTDDLNSVYGYTGNVSSGTPYSVSIIKLATKDATTGELIATIDDNNGTQLKANPYSGISAQTQNDQNIGKALRLQPGFYAMMFNQLDEQKPLYFYCSDETFDSKEFVRGNYKKLYNESDDRGSIYSSLNFGNNTAPTFVSGTVLDETIYAGQTFTRKVTAKDSNPYGTVTVEGLVLPSWITMTSSGGGVYTLTGTPSASATGTHNIELQASDGFNKTNETIIITVKSNPAPVFSTTPPSEAHQGVAFEYTAKASDMFNEAVTLTAPVLPTWLTATPTAGSIKLAGTPVATNVGSNAVKLLATDASGVTSQQIFDVKVFANAAPVFLSSPGLTGNAGTVYTYLVLCSDDNAGSTLTIAAAATLPTWLTLTATGNGMATLTGTPTDAGTNSISLSVTDALGAKSTQSFSIVVASNAAPVISSTAVVAGTENVLYVYNVTATDADGNSLSFETPGLPAWLTFTVTGNGKALLQGVPTQNYVGNSSVTIKVSDGNNTATQTFTIVVADVNSAPVIKSATLGTATEGEPFIMNIEATDEENDMLSFSANAPTWLTLVDNRNGTAQLKGIPAADQVGDEIITISVFDGTVTTEQVIGLTIKGVNKEVSESTSSEIKLYPNPAQGTFTLDKVEGYKVFVFNSAGVVVLQVENAVIDQKIDLSNYGSGTYIVKVMSEEGDVIMTRQITVIN